MGERFFVRRLLVPLLTICRENIRVENELICVVNDLLGAVGRGSGAGVHDYVINLPLDNLYRVVGGVCFADALVVGEPVGVEYDGVGLVQVVRRSSMLNPLYPRCGLFLTCTKLSSKVLRSF